MTDKWFYMLRELAAAEDARESAYDVEGNDGLPFTEIISDQQEAELALCRAWLKAREMLRQEETPSASMEDVIEENASTGLTDPQKKVLHYLLHHAYQDGFGSYYPLGPIATELGLAVAQLYDNKTNTGLLWELGPHGNGLIDVSANGRGDSARVPVEMRGLAEAWSEFTP